MMRDNPAHIETSTTLPNSEGVSVQGNYVIFALPRSMTAWLSRFLSYGDWVCGHDEIRYMRSFDDVNAWLSQPCTGTIETAGATWWRLVKPGMKVVTIRRPVADVVDSLMRIPGCVFDRDELTREMIRLDRKLDQIEARIPGVLSIPFDDLKTEGACAAVFEHCLPYAHDSAYWHALAPINIQIDMPRLIRYCAAYGPALLKLAAVARHRILADMAVRPATDPEGVTIQTESFADWVRDAGPLFDEHLVRVGESPGDWQRKNLPLMARLYDIGAMQITTARCNGRMFGYLMTLISPSLTGAGVTSGTHTTFFADDQFPGLGMKLQRAALRELKARGVDEVFWEAGQRGSGPRLGTMYRRLGGVEHSQTYRLDLREAA